MGLEDLINITANLIMTIKWQPNTYGGSVTKQFLLQQLDDEV
jgi:hypothetical protein